MYSMANCALTVYVWREHQASFNMVKHAILPTVATVMLLIVLYKTITSNQAYPLNWAPWVVVGWLVVGLAMLVWVETTNPQGLVQGSTSAVMPGEEVLAVGVVP